MYRCGSASVQSNKASNFLARHMASKQLMFSNHGKLEGVLMATTRSFYTPSAALLQKQKQTTAGYMAGANKVGNEEKWAQAVMEYIYEKNHINDPKKRWHDVEQEQLLSKAFDKYTSINERVFQERIIRLANRQSEVLEVLRAMEPDPEKIPENERTTAEEQEIEEIDKDGINSLLQEALLMSTEQIPNNFKRPSLSPPLVGYEPGFGLDVPQLRSQQQEYPAVVRPTDALQFGANSDAGAAEEGALQDSFPFVEHYRVEDLARNCLDQLEDIHGQIRATAPVTGVEGEGWEGYIALQKKALQRQVLILDLFYNNDNFADKYYADEEFRKEELRRRGLLPLVSEAEPSYGTAESGEMEEEKKHFAQVPAYEPFRKF